MSVITRSNISSFLNVRQSQRWSGNIVTSWLLRSRNENRLMAIEKPSFFGVFVPTVDIILMCDSFCQDCPNMFEFASCQPVCSRGIPPLCSKVKFTPFPIRRGGPEHTSHDDVTPQVVWVHEAEQTPLTSYEPNSLIEIPANTRQLSRRRSFRQEETVSTLTSATCPPRLRLVIQTPWMRE